MKQGKIQAISIVLSVLLLQGCAAAIPALMVASTALTGFSLYKTVQVSTGGSVDVGFSEVEMTSEESNFLTSVSSPMVWPNGRSAVYFAGELENSEVFSEVITPAAATRALEENGIGSDINMMTTMERSRVFKELCDETGADAVVAYRDLGVESSANVFSLERAKVVQSGEVIVYSRAADRIIVTFGTELTYNVGISTENEDEILRVAGEMAAEKILLLRGS